MNNTEKLLRAFIEASGYEVEEVLVNPRPLVCNDKPTNRMTYDYIDYKVTKRSAQVCFDVDSPEWSCVVGYILGAKEDIELGINNYGELKPMLDFFYGVKNEKTS